MSAEFEGGEAACRGAAGRLVIPPQYELVRQEFLEDIQTEACLLRHRKTGARLICLPAEDKNKVFFIAFRTPPEDSTGVAHIIEHTVLCGSRDFPVKDPFVELAKGSLNTFLNAMTYPDRTVYPVASCNDQDFRNLMHVYLDAVFYPRIYAERRIFEQEGWHYEAKSRESGITINGVVYNEMKGAMSDADSVLEREVMRSLFPHTPYAVESGGDPVSIPELSYEAYLAFHRRYYHPSNSYIYLYGDMDMEERLRYLDDAYLSRFDMQNAASEIPPEPCFAEPAEVSGCYSIMADEDESGKTYLAFNVALPADLNAERSAAFRVLDYVLCDAEGGPLKKALLRKGIGTDVSSSFDAGLHQPLWSVVVRGAEPGQKQAFLDTITEMLRDIVSRGFDPDALAAGINYHDFRYREADFGAYPKGLVFGLNALETWLYDDEKPWDGLKDGALYEAMKSRIGEGCFEALVKDFILDNTHRSFVMLRPKKGLTEERDAALAERLNRFAGSLSDEEFEEIVRRTERLRVWQDTPDAEEDMRRIPMLSREDLGREPLPYRNEFRELGGGAGRLLAHPVASGGICYVSLLFDIRQLPQHFYPVLPVLRTVFGALGTEHYDYAALNNQINIATGGISAGLKVYPLPENGEYRFVFSVSMKALRTELSRAFALLEEILTGTDWHDRDQIRDIIAEEYSSARMELPAAGHSTAANRAASYFSEAAKVQDDLNGIGGYRQLKAFHESFSETGEELMDTLAEGAGWIFARERCMVADVTADEAALGELEQRIAALLMKLPDRSALPAGADGLAEYRPYHLTVRSCNEGFETAGQVQYVCRAGNFLRRGLPYTGALKVLRVIMGYDYLWSRIRVRGGAYGCMSSFGRDGTSCFVSYRDPHLMETVHVYEEAADYLRSFDTDERTMTQYIIGTISGMDAPLTPAALGRYSLTGYLSGIRSEDLERERREVLSCTPEDIRALAAYVEAFMADGSFCVVGTQEQIAGNRPLFDRVEKLL
ncbi:insulinase family protein [Lachnoclostridium sp. Marseille-P6806]|uniref:insulinase family protein n=1 Tax=Lachnoclostridium sp. Marseille-P6806 TaxID=2364793 RepID=UPI0013EF0C92|nr:insulinase family protein [Lachnoclostridium sp. Marseille-P6806]